MSFQLDELLRNFEKNVSEYKIHPYITKFSIAVLFGLVFMKILSIPFYNPVYVIVLVTVIVTLSMLSPKAALLFGVFCSYPILVYQDFIFSIIYIGMTLAVFIISKDDWKFVLTFYIILMFGLSYIYVLSTITVLIYGYVFGSKKGYLMALSSSVMLFLFGYGLNNDLVMYLYFPRNINTYLYPLDPVTYNINLSYFDQYIGFTFSESSFFLSMFNIFNEKAIIVIQFFTMALSGYLSGDIQHWKIKYREIVAIPLSLIPIFLSYSLLHYVNNQSSKIMQFSIPFVLMSLVLTLVSPFLKIFLFNLDILVIDEIDTPYNVKRKITTLERENAKLRDANKSLETKMARFTGEQDKILMIDEVLSSTVLLKKSISGNEISKSIGVKKVELQKVLNYLSENGLIIYNKDNVIDKNYLKQKIYERMDVNYLEQDIKEYDDKLNKYNKNQKPKLGVKDNEVDPMWDKIITSVIEKTSIRVWNKMGYVKNETFDCWVEEDSITCYDPLIGENKIVNKNDLLITQENWDPYLTGEVSRLDLYAKTEVIKYTLSLMNHFKDT